MNNISTKNLALIVLLVAFAVIVLVWLAPLQRTAGVHIVSDIGI